MKLWPAWYKRAVRNRSAIFRRAVPMILPALWVFPLIRQKPCNRLLQARRIPIDLGSFNGRIFTYIAACGAFTRASYAVPQEKKNQWGNLAYIVEGLRELPTIRSFPLVVEAGDARFEDEFWWFSVTNAKSVGGLIRLGDDQVNLGDGKLEVMLIRPGDVGRILWALQTRKYDIPEISFCSADAVSIGSQRENDLDVGWGRSRK